MKQLKLFNNKLGLIIAECSMHGWHIRTPDFSYGLVLRDNVGIGDRAGCMVVGNFILIKNNFHCFKKRQEAEDVLRQYETT